MASRARSTTRRPTGDEDAMTLIETIKAMGRELTWVLVILSAGLGISMISSALNIEPIWPVIALFIGVCLILGAKI